MSGLPPGHWDGHFDNARLDLYVGNIPFTMQDRDLFRLAATYGSVLRARAVRDKLTGRPRGFGFVRCASEEERERVLRSLNGMALGTLTLSVQRLDRRGESATKEERTHG